MAVEAFLATRPQRAFIAISECTILPLFHHSLFAVLIRECSNLRTSVTRVPHPLSPVEAIVVVVLVGVVFGVVCKLKNPAISSLTQI